MTTTTTGAPRNPLNPATRRHIAMIAFFAWIGIGADGLSSSCYGPEEAFLAKLKAIDGISEVETQTYTLMPVDP